MASVYQPRYNVPGLKPAGTVEEVLGHSRGYPLQVEEVLEALCGPWERYINSFADRWTEQIKSDNFTPGHVDEFWTNVGDFWPELRRLNYLEVQALPPQSETHGAPAARTGRAMKRINDLIRPLHDAVRDKFRDSELLRKSRQKHAEQEARITEALSEGA